MVTKSQPSPILKPMSIKAEAAASFTSKVKCTSVIKEPTAVRIFEPAPYEAIPEGQPPPTLHDCMRDVQTAALVFVGSPESHPKVELRIAVLGDVGLAEGKSYRLTLEPLED